MKATKNSTPRVPVPKGNHISQLVGIIDHGTQTDKFGSRRKVEFLWETPEETYVFNEERGEEPFIIDRKFALTIGKKSALKEALEGLTGQKIEEDEIELAEYLSIVGMLNIDHEQDGEYTNCVITSYAPLSKSDAKRKFKPHFEPIILDLDDFDNDIWNSGHPLLPDWKKEIIMKSPECKEALANVTPAPAPAKQATAKRPVKPAATTPAKSGKAGELFSRKKK